MNNELGIIKLAVGEKSPYPHAEGQSIYYDGNGFTIITSLPNLTKAEINAFRTNRFTLRLCKVDKQVAFFHVDIEGFYNGEIAFSILKSGSTIKDMITEDNLYSNLFTFILVESINNKITAMRAGGVSQKFAKDIYEVCKEQTEYGLHDYENEARRALVKYSTPDIVNKFTISKYTLGE